MGQTEGDIHGYLRGPYIWSPLASLTSINKRQVMQNAALKTATAWIQDTNIHQLHNKTLRLPIHEHLQLHALQYKQKTQHTSHPLHKHKTYINTPRLQNHYLQQRPLHNNHPHTITTTDIKTNKHHIHTSIVSLVPKTSAYKRWNCQVIRPANSCHLIPSNRFLYGFPDLCQFATAKLTHYSTMPHRPSDSSRPRQRLLLVGDVHQNPGPATKYPCSVCTSNVTSRGVSYMCNRCSGWVHSKCSDLQNAAEYRRIKNWACSSCSSPPTSPIPKPLPSPITTKASD